MQKSDKKETKIIMKRIPCNQTIFGCILSAIIAATLLVVTAVDTYHYEPDCKQFPEIIFSTNKDLFKEILEKALANATTRLTIAVTDSKFELDSFSKSIENAKIAKNKIFVFGPNESKLKNIVSKYGLNAMYTNEQNYKTLISMVVYDDNAYLFTVNPHGYNPTQFSAVSFEKCQTAADDIQAFINYISDIQNNPPNHIAKTSMQSKISLQNPVIMNNSMFFTFYNHQNVLIPSRMHTTDIINEQFREEPKKMYIYTKSPPLVSSFTMDSPAFNLYYNIKTLLLRNTTDIYYLYGGDSSLLQPQEVWLKALTVYPHFHLNFIKRENYGPQFIIADDWEFFFGHDIRNQEINEHISLHYATNDPNTINSTLNFFNSKWEESNPYSGD